MPQTKTPTRKYRAVFQYGTDKTFTSVQHLGSLTAEQVYAIRDMVTAVADGRYVVRLEMFEKNLDTSLVYEWRAKGE